MLPDSYIPELSPKLIRAYLPNLQKDVNFIFTSEHTDDYNCVSWAININDKPTILKLPNGDVDVRLNSYVEYYKNIGFTETNNIEPQMGITKIAIYADGEEFLHVARQLSDGRWASKLGDWEDIEHSHLDALVSKFYGSPVLFLERNIPE